MKGSLRAIMSGEKSSSIRSAQSLPSHAATDADGLGRKIRNVKFLRALCSLLAPHFFHIPAIHSSMETKPNGNGNTAAIVATVLIVTLVVAIAIVVILVVVYGSGGNITVNCGSAGPRTSLNAHVAPKAGQPTLMQHNSPAVHQSAIAHQQPVMFQEQPSSINSVIPEFKGIGDAEGYAPLNQASHAGIMNSSPEALEKKWNPDKHLPSREAPVRPENSLGSKFGPSELEMQLYLPTPQELYDAKGNASGPKYIRRGPKICRDGDFRPLIVPEDYDDYDRVRRPNRPRVDKSAFQEVADAEKKYFQKMAHVMNRGEPLKAQ